MAGTESPFEAAARRPEVAVLFTITGGSLDAFAYVGHGHVFANAMTGNVALLGIHAAARDWPQAWRHVPPLLAFMVAVFVAHVAQLPGPRRALREPALACLLLEIAFLAFAAVAARGLPDAVLIPCIAFVATLQNTIFAKIGALSYNSVMTTGNLRGFAANLFAGTIPRIEPQALRRAALFGMVSLCFLVGAVIGGVGTMRLHDVALSIPIVLLTAALLRIVQTRQPNGSHGRDTSL